MAERSNKGWLAARAEDSKNSLQRETEVGTVHINANCRIKTGDTFINVKNPDGSYSRVVLDHTGKLIAYTHAEKRTDAREALVTMGVLAS